MRDWSLWISEKIKLNQVILQKNVGKCKINLFGSKIGTTEQKNKCYNGLCKESQSYNLKLRHLVCSALP